MEMTSRERWEAALTFKPVDRLPFWPKLGGVYLVEQKSRYRNMRHEYGDAFGLHEFIGSDPRPNIRPCYRDVCNRCSFTSEQRGNDTIMTYTTPHGVMLACNRWDEVAHAVHPIEFPIKSREDILLMTEHFNDIRVELDPEALEEEQKVIKLIGESGMAITGMGESALMRSVEWLAGVENAHYFLYDYQDEMEELFAAIHRVLLAHAAIQAEHGAAPLISLCENTSTTLISPDQYRDYCLPPIKEYAEIIRANGKMMEIHMCGLLFDLLDDLAKIPTTCFEAFTSPPLGNTRLADGRNHCPDICLVGGTNAPLWLKDTRDIIAELEQDLDALPHHRGLVITSAGVMPPGCPPPKIREICQWLRTYPFRN